MNKVCILLMLWITLLGCPAVVVGDEGSDFLDQREFEVAQIANQSIVNFGQQCDLLKTCGDPRNCSHHACSLGGTEGDFQCMAVNNNKYCSLSGATNTTCRNMNLDYSGSYVRLGESTILTSAETMLAICSQRALDPLFKRLSKPPVLTRVYFAPMDGSWRVYPGSASNADDCNKFDPRVRPWFRTSTSVPKVVVLVIDLGSTMGNNLPPDLGFGTIFQAAKKIAKQLLTTLSAQDFVNIILFDSARTIRLSPLAVLVQDRNGTQALELEFFKTELDKQTVEGQYRKSNLTDAMLAALPNFESNPLAAKVIIVITDGVFANFEGNTTLPTAELASLRVKVFMYKLKQPNDNDIFMRNNTLLQQLCAVGGHFEPILKNVDNPLLALQKYFFYLANLKRILTNGRPQYSYVYQDFEGIGGNIITISKPAFVGEELIGVAGLTIYIELLGSKTDQVKRALANRITGYSPMATDVELNAGNCSLVNETTQSCGENAENYVSSGGLCLITGPQSTIQSVKCCGTCSARPPGGGGAGLAGKEIAGIVAGSVAGLLGLVIVGRVAWHFWQKRQEEIAFNEILKAGPDMKEAGIAESATERQ